MSATINTELFARYFSQRGHRCPIVEIPGRTFPVAELYLNDVFRHCPGLPLKMPKRRDLDRHSGSAAAAGAGVAVAPTIDLDAPLTSEAAK
jgi:HrpA-like RNA helicase